MISQLSYRRFYKYQEHFRINVERTPSKATLVFSKVVSNGSFSDFTGDSERKNFTYEVPCLYRREFSEAQRTKYGLHDGIKGVIYIAPKHLQEVVGYWKFKDKFDVVLNEINYGIDWPVIYQAPFFNSCICSEVRLIDPDEQ